MELYPAIDLLDGACVRLYRGDYDQATVYGDDAVAQARSFVSEGARWVHMVDLDAARTGEARNRSVVADVAAALAALGGEGAADASADRVQLQDRVQVQVGGGVRDDAAADALLAAGIDRVVVGTAALTDPDWARRLARRYPGQVAVGLDARGRDVAVHGWTASSGRDLLDVAREFEDHGVAALVVTEIGQDGTLGGPALDQLGAVLEATSVPLVASGGVGSLADLQALAQLSRGQRRLAGAIVGRAIYEGAFGVSAAVAAVEQAGVEQAADDEVAVGDIDPNQWGGQL